MAITHSAIYNAVMAKLAPHRYYRGHDGAHFTAITPGRSDQLGALIDGAASRALKALYPGQQALIEESMTFDMRTAGFDVGEKIADQILADRATEAPLLGNEAAPATHKVSYGRHAVDPFDPSQPALSKNHGRIKRFCATTVSPMAPYPGGDAQGKVPADLLGDPHFRKDYEEVRDIGAKNSKTRTPDQTVIGTFWGYDAAQGLGVPPRLYNQIAREILAQRLDVTPYTSDTLEMAHAKFFATLHCALTDAGIDAWHYKYLHNLWRPVVAIRNEVDVAHGDAFWNPLGAPQTNAVGVGPRTPPFPAYPSGHATFGAAALQVIALFFDDPAIETSAVLTAERKAVVKGQSFDFISDELNGASVEADGSVRTLVKRSYGNYAAAVRENAESRVYLGVHWRFDGLPDKAAKDDGLLVGGVPLGLQIGNNAHTLFANLAQKP